MSKGTYRRLWPLAKALSVLRVPGQLSLIREGGAHLQLVMWSSWYKSQDFTTANQHIANRCRSVRRRMFETVLVVERHRLGSSVPMAVAALAQQRLWPRLRSAWRLQSYRSGAVGVPSTLDWRDGLLAWRSCVQWQGLCYQVWSCRRSAACVAVWMLKGRSAGYSMRSCMFKCLTSPRCAEGGAGRACAYVEKWRLLWWWR